MAERVRIYVSRDRSNFDIRHNFVANFTYDLPFSAEGRLKKLVEGWQLTGIIFSQSGRPGHVNYRGNRAGTGDTLNQRLDVLRYCSEQLRELIHNSSLAMVPACGHLPHFETPEVFNEIVLRFLGQQGAEG